MEAKFSPRVKDVISFSREEALRLGNDHIGVEHLLLGIIREGDGKAIKLLQEFNLDMRQIRKEIEMNLTRSSSMVASNLTNIPLVKQAEKGFKNHLLRSQVV